MKNSKKNRLFYIKWIVGILWLILLLFLLVHRNLFSLETILARKQENQMAAAFGMLGLFCLKSMTVVLYSGLLCAADGILFSLPLAFLISLAGSICMCTIPYFFGRWMGKELREELLQKYPKLSELDQFQSDNTFAAVLLARTVVRAPSDIVSIYFGACHAPFRLYLLSSILALIPHMISYPILGSYMHDPSSWQFLLSLAFEILWSAACFGFYLLWKKKKKP